MKKIALIVGCLLCSMCSIHATQKSLAPLLMQLQQVVADSIKHATNQQLIEQLTTYLSQQNALRARIDSLPYIGAVCDKDSTLRIVSWNYGLQNGSYATNAIFIKKVGKNKNLLHVFSTQQAQLPQPKKVYQAKNWYGALYYRIVKQKNRYLLLGYSTYQPDTRVKLIDVLNYRSNKPVLGESAFDCQGKKQHRMVFEYSSRVQMQLQYDESRKAFIFDHLSPEEPSMQGIRAYYGPDFSYDGLFYRKKYWTLQEDLDIKNEVNQ